MQVKLVLALGAVTYNDRFSLRASAIQPTAGALLRKTIYMGLPRDSGRLPQMTTLAIEMRRRLWNIILGFNLQMTLTSCTPPFFSQRL